MEFTDDSQAQCGVILLGNSGVGKSFLANSILNQELFASENTASSVTRTTRYCETVVGQHKFAVFDIPGLIEAEDTAIEANKVEISKAFQCRPNSIVAFVFGVAQGNRLRDEDMVAFHAINKAYPLKEDSLLIIVNTVKKKRRGDYDATVRIGLEKYLSIKVGVENLCLLEEIDTENAEEKQVLRQRLLQFLVRRIPMVHSKIHDIELSKDIVAKEKAEYKQLQTQFQSKENEWQEQRTRYTAEMKQREEQREKERKEWQRQQEEEREHARQNLDRAQKEWKKQREQEREQDQENLARSQKEWKEQWERQREREREREQKREQENLARIQKEWEENRKRERIRERKESKREQKELQRQWKEETQDLERKEQDRERNQQSKDKTPVPEQRSSKPSGTFTAAGAAVGTVVGGPVGTAVGGLLGAAVDYMTS